MKFRAAAATMLWLIGSHAAAGPGDIVYEEDFQGGTPGGWVMVAGDGAVGVGEFPPGGGEFSLYTCCGVVDARSPVIDTSLPGAQVSLTIQRGSNSIGSNKPENNDDLDVFFLNTSGTWQFIERLDADGDSGEVLNNVYTLDAQFLHSGFRIRLYQRNGNNNSDYWHLLEIRIIEAGASGGLGNLCDAFDSGLSNWTITSFGGEVEINSQTANSAPGSLAMFGGAVRIQSLPLDLANTASARLKLWVRRGHDSFSEDPDSNEDLAFGYIDDGGTYRQLAQLPGNGPPGQAYTYDIALPANALHTAFQVRIAVLDGDGGQSDYWHVDDVCIETVRSVDHFAILHDGSGVNCQAEPVRIVAHDADHFLVQNHTGTVTLGTSTGRGSWSLIDGAGVIVNNGNGSGSYSFAATDQGAVTLGLRDTFIETVNVNAIDSGITEHATEDNSLAFAETGFNFLVNGFAVPLPDQIAGKPSDIAPAAASIELQAIRTDNATGACEAAFTGGVTVELAFTCENPSACSGASLFVNGTAIAANGIGLPGSFTGVTLNFGDATDATAPLVLDYEDAGRIRLHAQKTLQPSGAVMQGASSRFVVRPFGFALSAPGNPAAIDANGGAFRGAGEDFTVNLRAVGWQAADDVDGDGMPDGYGNLDPADNADLSDNATLPGFGSEALPDTVTLNARLRQPLGGADPGLSGNTTVSGFAAGQAATSVRYNEVGILEMSASLTDADYLGTGDIISRSGPVGRFTPHHFDLVVGSHGCNDDAGMTYSGQPLRLLGIIAKNTDGITTRNFDGALGFAKNLVITEVAGAPGTVQNGSVSAADFSDGIVSIGTAPAGIAFLFDAKETEPASIVLRAMDTDGISSENFLEGLTEIRSARLVADDAAALLLVPADSSLQVETFQSGTWQAETEDTCTGLVSDLSTIALDQHVNNLDPGESTVDTDSAGTFLVNGTGRVRLTAPGIGNDGSLRVTYPAASWLEFDWRGAGPEDPQALVRFFDLYRSEEGLINRQEVVQ